MNTVTLNPREIIIPEDRFRDAQGDDVEALCVSILKYGQFSPILITRDNVLVAGLHRLKACILVEREVECVYTDQTDEVWLKEVELEENIRRTDMSWQEREQAIATIHAIRQSRDPNWGIQQTAALIDSPERPAAVGEAVKLTKMMEMFPEIAKAKNRTQALNMANQKAKLILRVEEIKTGPIDYRSIEEKIVHGDSVDVIKTLPNESFHAIVTDPPFGIDYESRTEGTAGSTSSYKDDKEAYERLLTMAPDLYRVLRPNGWLVWFLGISWYERVKIAFRQAGFTVDEIPIIWNRSEGRTFTSRPDRWFARGYDIAIHAIKGAPTLIQRGHNVITSTPVATADRETLVERPIDLYAQIIKRITLPGETVADFFVGSGSCPAAAASIGRNYFGVELSAERRAYAIQKIHSYTPDHAKSS